MSTINRTAHGLTAGQRVTFDNLVGGAPIDDEVVYYVLAAGLTADAFQISETVDGAPLTFATLTSADMTVVPETDDEDPFGTSYTAEPPGAVMEPPVAVPAATAPTVGSTTVSGIVRLTIALNGSPQAKVRVWEVQVTHQFDAGGAPVWDSAQVFNLPQGTTELTVPALGSTIYNVRVRAIDVYGNEGGFSTTVSATTLAGSDALNAALADIANDVPDGLITETKIADNSISTPKLQAGAVTAQVLAATIVLASLIKTSETGRRIEMDVDGIRLFDTDESLLVRIPTNGDPVYVKGEVNASSLISQTAAEFRTAASLAGSSVMTLQNGVAAPSVAPTVTASVDHLALTTTPPNLGFGIAYDAAAGTFWIAADPSVSDYVAHEYNATTGVKVRSIMATGDSETITATLGSTTHVTDGANGTSGSTDSHIASGLTMPRAGRITKVAAWFAGRSGTCQAKCAIWNADGDGLAFSNTFTAADEGTTGVGDSHLYNRSMTSPYDAADGQTVYAGFYRLDSGEGFQWDFDSGAGKTTKSGDGTSLDATGWGNFSTSQKPNVYITYEYDVETRLESSKMIGVATDGTHVYTLDEDAQLWKYLRSTGAFVATTDLSAHITGASAKAGLFYDATANELIVTTATTTAPGYPKFVRVTPSTLAVPGSYSASAGTLFNGTSDSFRGGARLNDPLNASAATYWVATTNAVYAYTFSGSTATQTANRDFGTAANVGDGLTYDGTQFRGYDTASPTKVWKFTDWDWTSASSLYHVGYAWYDSAGTTHETVLGPRATVAMNRRMRLQVQNPAIPTGGADDPNNVRIYMIPNATDPGAGGFKLQVTDALTARYLTTYNSGGAADGSGTPFAAGTPAELKSAGGQWSLKGDGSVTGIPPSGSIFGYGGTAAPTGYLLCDGTSYLRADYPALFTAIGTAYGSVDGTHFNVPDFRQRFMLGKATAGTGATLGGTGGNIDHNHGGLTGTRSLSQISDVATTGAGARLRTPDPHDHSIPTANPPFQTANFIIKT